MTDISKLLIRSRNVEMTDSDLQEQRASFAYGTAKLENEHITRKMVQEAMQRVGNEQKRR